MDWFLDQLTIDNIFFFSMVALRVELLGLVDLVSDKTAEPGRARVLMPNAVDPWATWRPPALRFDKEHRARILVEEGRVVDSTGLTATNYTVDSDSNEAFSIEGLDFQLALSGPDALTADRTPKPVPPLPPALPEQSLQYLAQMDDLMYRMSAEGHVPTNKGIDPQLLAPTVAISPPRLLSRLLMTQGRLEVSELWREEGKTDPALLTFQLNPANGSPPPYQAYMGRTLIWTVEVGDSAVFEFRHLHDGAEAGRLEVNPGADGLHVVIQNVEIEDENDDGAHFVGHYLLRENWDDIDHARFPETAGYVYGSYNNPQCSPADNQGGS